MFSHIYWNASILKSIHHYPVYDKQKNKMLFKPWSEFDRTPRHQLDELNESEIKKKHYEFSLRNGNITVGQRYNSLIIAPYNLGFLINDNLPNFTKLATVNVSITNTNDKIETSEDEYLDNEQLYSASGLQTNFQSFELSIFTFKSSESRNFNCITMPNLSTFHPMLYNKLSKYLICECLQPKELIILTPCALNYDQYVCKLISSKQSGTYGSIDVPFLKPPHFISGITAACFATATLHKIDSLALILDSEGVLNFERIKEDSISSAARILIDNIFNLNSKISESYLKEISRISSVSDYVNSGMYI